MQVKLKVIEREDKEMTQRWGGKKKWAEKKKFSKWAAAGRKNKLEKIKYKQGTFHLPAPPPKKILFISPQEHIRFFPVLYCLFPLFLKFPISVVEFGSFRK